MLDQTFLSVLECFPAGCIVVDSGGRIINVNHTAEAIFGYRREELIGQDVELLVPDHLRHGHTRARQDYSAAPTPRAMGVGRELVGRDKSGREIPVEVSLSPIGGSEGTVVLACITDISERRAQEARLWEAERKLREAEHQMRKSDDLRSLGILAAGLAHDLNNVLAGLLGHAQLALTRAHGESVAAEDMQEVLETGRRAAEFVNRISAFARGKQPRPSPGRLVTPVRKAVQVLRAELPDTTVVEFEADPATPPVMKDDIQVHRVVMNLGINAAKALPPGGGRITVKLRPVQLDAKRAAAAGVRPGHYAELRVEDNGVGMPSKVAARAFETFFTTRPDEQGSGLGLSIVRSTVRGLGGEVRLTSTVGAGTTVVALLPALTESPPTEQGTRDLGRRTGHVLFVDDQPQIVTLGRRMLEVSGFVVTGSTSPREALDAFTAHPNEFDALVADYLMPELTGAQLIERLSGLRPDLATVMLTVWTDDPLRMKEGLPSAKRVLPKPFTRQELTDAVLAALREVGDQWELRTPA